MPFPDKASDLTHLVPLRTPPGSARPEFSHKEHLYSAAAPRPSTLSIRPLFSVVHAINLPVFAAALATGVLLFSPTLRAALVSGYSESIRAMHRWLGRAQIVLALAIAVRWLWVRREAGEPGPWNAWRASHVSIVAAAAIGFALTGTVMASPSSYPLSIVDYSFVAHLYITYLSCALVAVHAAVVLRYSHRRVILDVSDHIDTLQATEKSNDAV